MTHPLVLNDLLELDVLRLAEHVAFALLPGDVLALEGDLGAGKTTFARALISTLSAGAITEVPSPTFTLVQSYETARFDVAHFDLYRLTEPSELLELGLDLALKRGIAVIEWPSRAGSMLPDQRFTLTLSDGTTPETRTITIEGTGACAHRVARLADIYGFLSRNGWGGTRTRLSYLQGDASPRRYARLIKSTGVRAILMDAPRQPDGPPIRDGLPYSRIAHLAEDVRPFVAIGTALAAAGFSTPELFAHDIDRGLLLIEDLGDAVFGAEVQRGGDQRALWARGVSALAALRRHRPSVPLPVPDGSFYKLPPLDHGTLQIESELLLDWYWPALHGSPVPPSVREAFLQAWHIVFTRVLEAPKGWVLRDYHSPNLLALAARPAPRDIGIIDFQDALLGPEAYDLVSLLQDARLDVPEALEHELLDRYIADVQTAEPAFDAREFRFGYAALGAQRNTKILGIFARLAKRDGKRHYLTHIPRIWGYLARDLAHPDLTPLKTWYDAHLPAAARSRALPL
jgi:tRNA threonylcarbamoyl adenosine modification protein YjeE